MSVFVKRARRRGPGEEGLKKKGPEKKDPEKGNREQRAKNCFLTEVWMSALCVAALGDRRSPLNRCSDGAPNRAVPKCDPGGVPG